jgi:hypothetical protein
VIGGTTKAFLAGPNGDNPLIIGPIGIAPMSVLDFARWAGWDAGEGRREPKSIQPPTLKELHHNLAIERSLDHMYIVRGWPVICDVVVLSRGIPR